LKINLEDLFFLLSSDYRP